MKNEISITYVHQILSQNVYIMHEKCIKVVSNGNITLKF